MSASAPDFHLPLRACHETLRDRKLDIAYIVMLSTLESMMHTVVLLHSYGKSRHVHHALDR